MAEEEKNSTLKELLLAVLLLGIAGQAIVWIAGIQIAAFSISWWIGIAASITRAIHMAWSFRKALADDGIGAEKTIRTQSMIRYVVIVLILIAVGVSKVLNPLITFAGVFSLKIAAFLQPVIHKSLRRIPKK